MRRSLLAVSSLVALCASSAWAAPPTAAATAAKKAVAGIGGDLTNIPDLAKQSQFAMNELSDEVYALPKNERKYLTALADWDGPKPGEAMDQGVVEEAKPFLEKLCGTSDMTVLGALSPDKVISKCHLKEHNAVPSVIAKTMRPSSMLYAAFVIDLLGKDATADQRTLALWISHYGRSDATTAKPIKKP